MKTALNFIIIVLVLGLILPDANVFAYSVDLSGQALAKLTASRAAVRVIHLPTKAYISVPDENQTALLAVACSKQAPGSGMPKAVSAEAELFLQNTGQVNLNQPANCLSLQIKFLMPSAIQLAVKPLALDLPAIAVSVNQPVITAPNLAAALPASKLPALPLAAVSILTGFLWVERKISRQKFYSINPERNFQLTLARLNILRC